MAIGPKLPRQSSTLPQRKVRGHAETFSCCGYYCRSDEGARTCRTVVTELRVRAWYPVAPTQHRQDRVLVIDESLSLKLAGCKFVRCISCQQQQRQRLIALSNNLHEGSTWSVPSYSFHVDFRLQ